MNREKSRRVAITGVGSINALASGAEGFAEALRQGRCGIADSPLFAGFAFRSQCAAQVRDLQLPEGIPSAVIRRSSRSTKLALVAAIEAWNMSRAEPGGEGQTGIVIGTTTGGMSRGEESYQRILRQSRREAPLSAWLETPAAAPAEVVALVVNCGGPRLTVSTACSSGANALGIGADWIRRGRVDTVLAGGVDSLCLMTYSGFDALQTLDRTACKPFDRHRAGLSLGEGAAMFVFEAFERARERGARILGEFVSYGVSTDAHHPTQPRPDGAGAACAMRQALQEGRLGVEEIDYVNAHGTGTPLNDSIETRAIKTVLGAHAYRIPISSTKSMVGHCLGAAGAIEALASLLAIRGQFVPPTASLQEPDPECDLDYVPIESRPAVLRTVLSNSYGFGGNNTALVIRAAED